MEKQNCWKFKRCGREPYGSNADELGVCPAAIEKRLSGSNSGSYGGRACWAITGTLCGDKVQGTFAAKLSDCMECDFYILVSDEEGHEYENTKNILRKLQD